MKRLAKELKNIAQGQKPPTREQAERLHEMAEKMLQPMSPEKRREVQQIAEEFARQQPEGGPGTEPGAHPPSASRPWRGSVAPVDARRAAVGGDRPQERTLAEWYGDGKAEKSAGAPGAGGALREAARGAERAIEQQEVPARYSDLVRRVFKRYAEGADKR